MATPNPHVLSVVGEGLSEGCRILAFLWEGATSSGNTCEVRDPSTNALLFPGRTEATQTFQGLSLSPGIQAPNGYKLGQISAGRVLVYRRVD